MERSVEKTDAYDIPRKSRPLDSLSVATGKYTTPSAKLRPKDRASVAAPQSKVLKRKRSSSLHNGATSEFRKRSGKEVSLNSFVKSNGKGKLKAAVAGFKANGLASDVCKQEKRSSSNVAVKSLRIVSGSSHHVGNDFTLSSGKDENKPSSAIGLHRSNCLEGGIIITKRPRGVLRRKKNVQSVNSYRDIVGASSNTRSSTDQRSNKLSESQFQIHEPKRKLTDFKENASTNNVSHSCTRNAGNLDPVKATERRFEGRKEHDSNLLDNKGFLLNSLRVFPDDDEDNLEQNAARMLSSRFDPSCAGFSHHSRGATLKQAKESSLVLSRRNSNGSGVERNDTGRVLRPRKHGGRGFVRKRRHFYEVCSNNMDPYWVVKQRIRVFWPLDKCWYFGLVKDYDPRTKMHHVKYDDRDEEWINLQNERFKLLLFPSEVANKFSHEGSIKEAKNRDKQGHKRSGNDLSTGGLVETEPIISWLTRSTRRERPSALGIVKTQRRILLASKGFKRVGIPNALPSLSSSLLDESAEDGISQNLICSEGRKLPFVYFRRRIRKDSGCLGNIVERNSDHVGCGGPISLLASFADTESALKKLYITLIPQVMTKVTLRLSSPVFGCCQSMLGSDNWLMRRSLFLLHNYKLMQLLPLVRMEVGFVDNLSLKLFLFEGCLSWAVAFLSQTLRENYCHKNSHTPSAEIRPLKKIRINLLNLHNNHQKLDFVVDGFVESDSRWRYLEMKLLRYCIRFKELSLGDCAYAHFKSQSIRCDRTLVQLSKEAVVVEDGQESKYKSNYNPVEESDQVSDITLENFGSSSTVATDSKLSSFGHLRVDTDALSLSNDGDCLMSSHDYMSIEVNVGSCSVRYSDVGKNSSDEMLVRFHKLPEHSRSYKHPENLCSSCPGDPSSPDKSEGGCISSSKTTGMQTLRGTRAEERTLYRGTQDTHSTSKLLWDMNENSIHTPNATASQSVWHHNRHILVSPILGRSTLWSEDFIQSGLFNTTKKPRTQVSYPVLNRGHDIRSKSRIYHRKSSIYKKFKADLPKKLTVGLDSHRSFQESLTCHANVLITTEDRGWREFGAEVIVESDDQKDWKIMVKLAGITKFSYKAQQVLQPGIPNRYTHAMMWKGGKEWSLEFTDRNQWFLFKMMHGHCFNQNIRAASVKNIPIPGVRLIDGGNESFTEVPFVRNSSKYYQMVGTEVETALDPSHVLYDMDSDDEKWISKFRDSLDNNESTKFEVTDDMFERVMDMFEKVAYVKQCDCLTDDEIAEFMADFGSLDIIKAIHELWHEKRRKKGMPLIRQYQPPLWECYQQQLKEWELAMINLHCPANEFQEKATAPENPPEKPPMFAFCLKPRGLEANKGSKQRSHKKLMYSGHHSLFAREHDGLHASGRRLNISSVGDEKALFAIPTYEGFQSTQWLQSPLSFSPRDARTAILMASDVVDRNHYPKLFRNFSKKNGVHHTPWDSSVMPLSCPEKSKRNGVYRFNSDTLEWPSSKHLQPDGVQRQQPDINEFRLRDASGAAQHASNMAKLKREKAQWLMHKADLALHKAVVAIMTADAIKTSQKDLIGGE
ncbi:uncharacterized protein LOC110110575 [Dendrobium catenatum]|uniref:Enhancer of polycomb-like protein n=1 Tax=Dendrobium catenatum TaxID=906689 RepID=A0A2I0WIA3_9ASPA|nr:uncharacterized protein LOC110110575 [Dendrobium catenatum]XP_020697887.1 uncharacterized protein LOC110110575 [Dendrobium catenatum]PKU75400.1 Histone-lysine N-methyltransferase ATX2 [Dendrobium catenatum]